VVRGLPCSGGHRTAATGHEPGNEEEVVSRVGDHRGALASRGEAHGAGTSRLIHPLQAQQRGGQQTRREGQPALPSWTAQSLLCCALTMEPPSADIQTSLLQAAALRPPMRKMRCELSIVVAGREAAGVNEVEARPPPAEPPLPRPEIKYQLTP
jgi:hypothetical protein